MSVLTQKICLVGDFAVGKTSLIRRFVDRSFSDQYLTTVGVKISRKLVNLESGLAIQLVIWDLEGSTKFKAVSSTYLQGAAGAIIVADATRPDTIDHIDDHCRQFYSINPDKPIVIALNKYDLVSDQLPNVSQAHMTSAKTGYGVDELFYKLSQKILGGMP
ncbi:MAG: Rab family GTPase [Pseudanabaenaceae cyanobacterium SKYGB_i_bin29]|nr:GTP-binding protein [Pseudanabaenaceae cyanobacterium SKYG29]MDW8422268.1 Rab family GTPase [Pseudanabaenaceae cyanobacterium SKYGB_i_bin29]